MRVPPRFAATGSPRPYGYPAHRTRCSKTQADPGQTLEMTVIAQDPSVTADGRILTASVAVPPDRLLSGPGSHCFEIVDRPSRAGCFSTPGTLVDLEFGELVTGQPVAHCVGVVAMIEVQRADIDEQTGGGDGVKGGFEHAHVMTVGVVDRPADEDAVCSDAAGTSRRTCLCPLGPGRLPHRVRRFVEGPVDAHVIELEAHDAVDATSATCFIREDAGQDPAIHSSGRARSVVSEIRYSTIASMPTQEAPVTSRIRTPQKHDRFATRGRWQTSG